MGKSSRSGSANNNRKVNLETPHCIRMKLHHAPVQIYSKVDDTLNLTKVNKSGKSNKLPKVIKDSPYRNQLTSVSSLNSF